MMRNFSGLIRPLDDVEGDRWHDGWLGHLGRTRHLIELQGRAVFGLLFTAQLRNVERDDLLALQGADAGADP